MMVILAVVENIRNPLSKKVRQKISLYMWLQNARFPPKFLWMKWAKKKDFFFDWSVVVGVVLEEFLLESDISGLIE